MERKREDEPAPPNNHGILGEARLKRQSPREHHGKARPRGRAFTTLLDYSDYLNRCYVQSLSTNTPTILAYKAQLRANLS